jgi:hypothetical protein
VPLENHVRHAAAAQMLAHGEACLATANNQRIYLFNWHIPVHSWLSN